MTGNEDRLNSWKEIAEYLAKDVATCITWSRRYQFPVYHIDKDSPRSSVYAYKSEIEKWFKSRTK